MNPLISKREREYFTTIVCTTPTISGENVYYEYMRTDRKDLTRKDTQRIVAWFKREGINARIETIEYKSPDEWSTIVKSVAGLLDFEDMK